MESLFPGHTFPAERIFGNIYRQGLISRSTQNFEAFGFVIDANFTAGNRLVINFPLMVNFDESL
ncbi:MAG: hypothetical protein LBK24_01870 [Puniceicoccales bacterium]|jgi:hypothetical protein|nr:hypothetical protein [Puniceicoccales bacterium]